jgi:hypothetical protein
MNIPDNRRSSNQLIKHYNQLVNYGWVKHLIINQQNFPITAYISPIADKTNQPVSSLWIQGGIHGEEPASGEAFYEEIDFIGHLGSIIPMVFMPLLNPAARDKDWRYENEFRDFTKGLSVTACDHVLINDSEKLRSIEPVSDTAKAVVAWIIETIKTYPPLLVIDHHEDRIPEDSTDPVHRALRSCYVYLSGDGSTTHKIGKTIIDAMRSTGLTIAKHGNTRFGETIKHGLIQNTADGSIDEFYTTARFYNPSSKQIETKPVAKTVVVVETTVPIDEPVPLNARVAAQQAVIKKYPELWALATSQE